MLARVHHFVELAPEKGDPSFLVIAMASKLTFLGLTSPEKAKTFSGLPSGIWDCQRMNL
jgi:hypothetical protein